MTRKTLVSTIIILLISSSISVAQPPLRWLFRAFSIVGLIPDPVVEAQKILQRPQLPMGLYLKNNLDNQGYALEVEGATYIGNGYRFDDDEPEGSTRLNLAHFDWLPHRKLFVEDGIATEELVYLYKDDWDNWPDYVFEDNYSLQPLQQVKAFIAEHQHLPDMPSEKVVKEHGINDKEMTEKLLKKIEELSLYIIQQHKTLQQQQTFRDDISSRIAKLTESISKIESSASN